jgi:hypothetical protein
MSGVILDNINVLCIQWVQKILLAGTGQDVMAEPVQ